MSRWGIYYGGTIAAPVIADIFSNILPYLDVERVDPADPEWNFCAWGVKVRNRYKFRLIIKRKGRILFTRQTGKCDEKQAGPAIFT